jgi:hypothetical protein
LVQDSGSGNTTANNFDFMDEIAALSRLAVLDVLSATRCLALSSIKSKFEVASYPHSNALNFLLNNQNHFVKYCRLTHIFSLRTCPATRMDIGSQSIAINSI